MIENLLSRLGRVEPNGSGWKALCPAHEDYFPSLSIDRGAGGKILLHCHGGCKTERVLEELGLTWGDLSGAERTEAASPPPKPRKEALHQVHGELLGLLDLTAQHRSDLVARGLPDEVIARNQYRSLHWLGIRKALKALYEKHGDTIAQIPGVYLDGGNPRLTVTDGLLIPVRSHDGQVVAFQVRQGGRKKYTWLSSRDAKSGAPAHVPLGMPQGRETVWLTEGPLKADVVTHFLAGARGEGAVGVGGVTAWRAALGPLADLKAARVVLAYDGDWRTKDGVRDELTALAQALTRAGYQVDLAVWPESHKGIDDALLAGADIEIRPWGDGLPGQERAVRADTVPAEPKASPEFVRAADLEELPIEWLWPGWLAKGFVQVLDGDPGLGKSLLFCEMAARLTTGRPLPRAESVPPTSVIIATAEDDSARTIKPRLRVAGADQTRVWFWSGVKRVGQKYMALPQLPGDLEVLEEHVRETGAGIVFIDPLVAYFDSKHDAIKDQHVREVLTALGEMARRTQCCVVGLRHLNKQSGQKAIYRGGNSIAIIGTARAGMLLAQDQEEGDVRHLFLAKTNIGRPQVPLKWRLGMSEGVPAVMWEGDSDADQDEILSNKKPKDRDAAARVQWLTTFLLAGPPEGRHYTEVYSEAAKFGWSVDQLKRASSALGVRKDRSTLRWSLPVDPRDMTTDDASGVRE